MDRTRKKIMLGILGGGLIVMGLGVVFVWASFLIWSHHMFIIGLQFPAAILPLSLPFVLLIIGIFFVVNALRRERA